MIFRLYFEILHSPFAVLQAVRCILHYLVSVHEEYIPFSELHGTGQHCECVSKRLKIVHVCALEETVSVPVASHV